MALSVWLVNAALNPVISGGDRARLPACLIEEACSLGVPEPRPGCVSAGGSFPTSRTQSQPRSGPVRAGERGRRNVGGLPIWRPDSSHPIWRPESPVEGAAPRLVPDRRAATGTGCVLRLGSAARLAPGRRAC